MPQKENQMQQTSTSVDINQTHHFSFIKLAKIKTLAPLRVDDGMSFYTLLVGMGIGTSLNDNLAILIESLNIFTLFDTVITLLETYPKAVVATWAIYQSHLWSFMN